MIYHLRMIAALVFIVGPTVLTHADLTAMESKIYVSIVEKYHDALYDMPKGRSFGDVEMEAVGASVAGYYGVSSEEVERILDKSIWSDTKYTSKDWAALEELNKRLDELPEWATQEDTKRIHREVAGKYGLYLLDLHEMEFIDFLDWYYFFGF